MLTNKKKTKSGTDKIKGDWDKKKELICKQYVSLKNALYCLYGICVLKKIWIYTMFLKMLFLRNKIPK